MSIGQKLRRVRGRISGHKKPELVYICSPGCFTENDIRETMKAVRDVYRSGNIPVCPCVMFPSDSTFMGAAGKVTGAAMRFRLMDVCQSFLICGRRWTEETRTEFHYAVTRGMEIKREMY